MQMEEITADDNGTSWLVKFGAGSGEGTILTDNWWKASMTVVVARVASESIEALTKRAEAKMRAVVGQLTS